MTLCASRVGPNRAAQTDLLKEMFGLTDEEALEQLGLQLLRHHALRLDISNIATLTRLGLFCETVRLFIATVRREIMGSTLPRRAPHS